jgi:hypothetical protein
MAYGARLFGEAGAGQKGAGVMIQRHVRQAPHVERFTVHDTRIEKVALIVDPALPWVVRKGGKYPTIVGRYASREEADCACLGANHAAKEEVVA